jgi:hypothetical protein
MKFAGPATFTEALDPPDFGRIGHPALTVALRITSREPRTVEDHPETSTSTVLPVTVTMRQLYCQKTNFLERDLLAAWLNDRLIDLRKIFVDGGCQKCKLAAAHSSFDWNSKL